MPKKFVARIRLIDEMIQKRKTSNATMLAQSLKVSERTAKEFIAVMKSLGAPINYSRKASSYCYLTNGRFVLQFEKW